MRNLVILAVVFGVVGLVVGYLIFGRYELGNELIPLGTLFSGGDTGVVGAVRDAVRDAVGFAQKRQNIYISGGVGVVAGIVLGFALKRRR